MSDSSVRSPDAGGDVSPRGALGYHYPTVFITGASVMVIELLGSRILAPYYGSSLFVWSSLITVTLVALAAGYWLGGLVADRIPRASVLYGVVALSGLITALIAPLRNPVLQATDVLGVRGGSLASSFLLFTAPLLLLGMVSPYAVKLSTRSLGRLARTAGRLYAVSTVGSFVGTLGAGFFLIPSFEVSTILFIVALVLLCVSVVFFTLARRAAYAVASVVIIVLPLTALIVGSAPVGPVGDSRLIAKESSFYGEIKVVDKGPLRFMLIDGAVQSSIDRRNGLCSLEYPYAVEILAYRANPGGKRALIVGLGGGLIPEAMASWGVISDIVEIDPKIAMVATEHLGFDPERFNLHFEDGRRFMEGSDGRYDYVILDAFAGEMVPIHLLSKEAFEAARGVMTPDGVVILNYVGYREGPDARVAASIEKTLGSVFDSVAVYESGEKGEFGSNIYVAGTSDLVFDVGEGVEDFPFPIHEVLSEKARHMDRAHLPDEGAIVFTDHHNPIDLWDLEGRERWRSDTMEFFPKAILLG